MNGKTTVETAIAVARKCKTREPLKAKPIAVVDVSSASETSKIKKERPSRIAVSRSFVIGPIQFISANSTYTLSNGANVSSEQDTTCLRYPRVVLGEDCTEEK